MTECLRGFCGTNGVARWMVTGGRQRIASTAASDSSRRFRRCGSRQLKFRLSPEGSADIDSRVCGEAMGILSDFFAATDAELEQIVPGWKKPAPPLAEPLEFDGVNPWTREPTKLKTWLNPEQPEADADAAPSPLLQGYDHVLEWKRITDLELAELCSFITGTPIEEAIARVMCELLNGPPEADDGLSVSRVPEALVQHVGRSAADEGELERLAEGWAAHHTEDDSLWTPDDFLLFLRRFAPFAKRASESGREVYLAARP